MALTTQLTYTKVWDAANNPGATTFPAAVDTEADARANLESQHDEAQAKINEIVGAIATSLISNDDSHIPTVKAVKSAIVQSDWTESDPDAADYIKNKPAIPSAQVQADWEEDDPSEVDYIKNKPPIPTVSGTSGKIAKFTGTNAVGDAFTVTISSSDPTGGSNGDIWFKYEA